MYLNRDLLVVRIPFFYCCFFLDRNNRYTIIKKNDVNDMQKIKVRDLTEKRFRSFIFLKEVFCPDDFFLDILYNHDILILVVNCL